jgi:hypothetical protein
MRFWFTAAIVVGLCINGAAQVELQKPIHQQPTKVKSSDVDLKSPASEAKVKPSGGAEPRTTQNKTSKDLQSIERQSSKAPGSSHTSNKKTSAALMKTEKTQATPKININGATTKGTGGGQRSGDPYKGRLKQKHRNR